MIEQSRRLAHFASEAALHAAVSAYFTGLCLPHRNQHPTGSGLADVLLELPDGRPLALLELKNALTPEAPLADLSDFLEQCVKYRLQAGLPVFLGPFFVQGWTVVNEYLSGGARLTALGAFSALAGRLDVGLLFVQAITGHEASPLGWFGFQLLLRQQRIAAFNMVRPEETLWPTSPIPLVDLGTAGSRKDRQ